MRTFNAYQDFTKSLACYNEDVWLEFPIESELGGTAVLNLQYMYPVLALAEEAGEVAGKVAKYVRKSASLEPDFGQLRTDVLKELGDVAYQLSEVARQFGFTLQEVIDANVSKLTDRQERGVLVGEGDNR